MAPQALSRVGNRAPLGRGEAAPGSPGRCPGLHCCRPVGATEPRQLSKARVHFIFVRLGHRDTSGGPDPSPVLRVGIAPPWGAGRRRPVAQGVALGCSYLRPVGASDPQAVCPKWSWVVRYLPSWGYGTPGALSKRCRAVRARGHLTTLSPRNGVRRPLDG